MPVVWYGIDEGCGLSGLIEISSKDLSECLNEKG